MRSTLCQTFVTFDDEESRYLPEGPRAATVDGREAVAWIDIQTSRDSKRGAVHLRFWDDGEHGVWNLTGRPGFILPTDKPGVLFVGMDKEVGALDLATNEFTTLARIPDDSPHTMINDGQVVPGGQAVVFGTKDVHFKAPIANLYLFTLADRAISVLRPGQQCSNGKVIHAENDGLIVYDIDTPTRTVVRYRLDLADRTATPEGVVVDVHGFDGFPDGMCDAGDGSAIVAFYNPSVISHGKAIRFDLRSGQPIEEWRTPAAPRVTCPLLVMRPDGVKLIVTTAVEEMSTEDQAKCPNSGFLFIGDTDLSSFPATPEVKIA